VNYHKHNYNGSFIAQALSSPSSFSDSLVYVQGMAGVKGKITLPTLQNLGRVLVNKAEIEITRSVNKFADDSLFAVPEQMICIAADSNGNNAFIPDQLLSLSGQPEYGGKKVTITDALGNTYVRYRFSIAAQLQLIIDQKKTDYGFYLLSFPSNQLANRIILGGGNRSGDNYQMKLNLAYTKLK
jgi:hypothetical protein